MTKQRILVVEDEAPIRQMLVFTLSRAGFEVDEAGDSAGARIHIVDSKPDLVLIDWMLPDSSGLELTRSLRRDKTCREIPVIMLTARTEEKDKLMGLESGADDYITKPFSSKELLARVKAVLRRSAPNTEEPLKAGSLQLNPVTHRVTVEDSDINLGPTEFRLLMFLMQHPERVYSREQLLDYVWARNVFVEERTVDVHIRRLRKALEAFAADHYVQTVRGAGYRFSVH